jgi:uncharacterized membrane protein YgdD (TMEM256/DUF423 family)
MSNSAAFRIATALGFVGIGLGAFGAHGLKGLLMEHGTLAIWEKAVFYHLIHTVVLLILASRAPLHLGPWLCIFAGICIFSGSLYLLALTNVKLLGAITPFGGLSFMVGWLWLAICPRTAPGGPA